MDKVCNSLSSGWAWDLFSRFKGHAQTVEELAVQSIQVGAGVHGSIINADSDGKGTCDSGSKLI